MIRIGLAFAAALPFLTGCTSFTSLAAQHRFAEFCRASENDFATPEENLAAARAFVDEHQFDLQARILPPGDVEERLGLAPAPDARFVEVRWSLTSDDPIETELSLEDVDGERGRNGFSRTNIPSTLFPMPAALEPVAVPDEYIVVDYEPTPRPGGRLTGDGATRGVVRALTFGQAGRGGRRLTRASQRALDRWQAENAEPRSVWQAEQRRLQTAHNAAVAVAVAENERRAPGAELFETRRAALLESLRSTQSECRTITSECVEILVLVEHERVPTVLSAVLRAKYREWPQCILQVHMEGEAGADSAGALDSRPTPRTTTTAH